MIGRLSQALTRFTGRRGRLDALADLLYALDERTRESDARIAELTELVRSLPPALADLAAQRAVSDERLEAKLRFVVDDEAENRRRLHALRNSPEYELPYTIADPLVSITIATRDRPHTLVTRALPSLLEQTHRNVEVIVVGDAAGPDVADAVAGAGDARVRYANLTQRTTAHPDPAHHALVGSTIPRNEATRLARGSWMLHFDDDDRLAPDAVASLLELARASHAEVVYGGFVMHRPGLPDTTLMEFPPRTGAFGWQGALAHAGLRFFERERIAAYYGLAGDAYLLQRMLAVGVRFRLLERTIWEYFPSHDHEQR